MRRVFVDSSYLLAIFSPRDNLHSVALTVAAELRSEGVAYVTTEPILIELLALVRGKGADIRQQAAKFAQDLLASTEIDVIQLDRDVLDEALALYARRSDKKYSLTDCISMVVCRRQRISEVLTHDRDFEREGLIALLRVRAT